MKKFFSTKFGRVFLAFLILALLGGAAFGGYSCWLYTKPKFQDVTIELGTTSLGIEQFTTQYARLSKCRFASDLSEVNIGAVGQYPITLTHGRQQQTVNLTIQDTTAPRASFHSQITRSVGYVPEAMDFVADFSDYSEVTVFFEKEPVLKQDHSDVKVRVVVEDAHGNQTIGESILITGWLKEAVTAELGIPVTKADVLLSMADEALIDQLELDDINNAGVGEYTLLSVTGGKTMECIVTVVDTTAPTLKVKDWHVYPGTAVKPEDFVASCKDASGDVKLSFVQAPDVDTLGRTTVQVKAEDAYGNATVAEAALNVSTDIQPPKFGTVKELTVPKNSDPDFLAGITAADNVDERVSITCDTSKVDMTRAGTYYLTYTATDSAGNEATTKRKIIVEHDQADTWALVEEIAKTLENDPEKLRDYVRSKIGYNSAWGGDDPVWYGFKNRGGNCYVHALCLDALLQYYGYETQLIWVKDKTHYWLLINLEGIGWRHIDPTPSSQHGRFSLMTDKQRLATLSGRKWDTTAWPAAQEPVEETEEKK